MSAPSKLIPVCVGLVALLMIPSVSFAQQGGSASVLSVIACRISNLFSQSGYEACVKAAGGSPISVTGFADDLVARYSQIHDYDLKETYSFFDGSTKVSTSTYIQPAQQTPVGILGAIKSMSRQGYSVRVSETDTGSQGAYFLLKVVQAPSLLQRIFLGQNITNTYYVYIDKTSMLPFQEDLYIAGPDALFEKFRNSPAIVNMVYGKAGESMGIPTNNDGVRLFSSSLELSNINTRMSESAQCSQYDERTGICVGGIHRVPQSGNESTTLAGVQQAESSMLLPTYMPTGFSFFNTGTETIPVEEPYILAQNISTAYFYYSEKPVSASNSVPSSECGTSPVYTKCHNVVDFSIKVKLLQSADDFLMFTNLPDKYSETTTKVNGNEAVFIGPSGAHNGAGNQTETLRWKEGSRYMLLVFSNTEPSNGISLSVGDMVKIAESVIPASQIRY